MSQGAGQAAAPAPPLARRLRVSAAFACGLALLAALGLDFPALILGLFGALGFLAGAIWDALRRRPDGARLHGAKAGIYALLLAVAGAISASHANGARARAGQIVEALDAHAARTGAWPESLDELVPGELAAVPAPSRAPLGQERFVYRRSGEHYLLAYRALGFAAYVWTSDTRAWRVRD